MPNRRRSRLSVGTEKKRASKRVPKRSTRRDDETGAKGLIASPCCSLDCLKNYDSEAVERGWEAVKNLSREGAIEAALRIALILVCKGLAVDGSGAEVVVLCRPCHIPDHRVHPEVSYFVDPEEPDGNRTLCRESFGLLMNMSPADMMRVDARVDRMFSQTKVWLENRARGVGKAETKEDLLAAYCNEYGNSARLYRLVRDACGKMAQPLVGYEKNRDGGGDSDSDSTGEKAGSGGGECAVL